MSASKMKTLADVMERARVNEVEGAVLPKLLDTYPDCLETEWKNYTTASHREMIDTVKQWMFEAEDTDLTDSDSDADAPAPPTRSHCGGKSVPQRLLPTVQAKQPRGKPLDFILGRAAEYKRVQGGEHVKDNLIKALVTTHRIRIGDDHSKITSTSDPECFKFASKRLQELTQDLPDPDEDSQFEFDSDTEAEAEGLACGGGSPSAFDLNAQGSQECELGCEDEISDSDQNAQELQPFELNEDDEISASDLSCIPSFQLDVDFSTIEQPTAAEPERDSATVLGAQPEPNETLTLPDRLSKDTGFKEATETVVRVASAQGKFKEIVNVLTGTQKRGWNVVASLAKTLDGVSPQFVKDCTSRISKRSRAVSGRPATSLGSNTARQFERASRAPAGFFSTSSLEPANEQDYLDYEAPSPATRLAADIATIHVSADPQTQRVVIDLTGDN